MPSGPRGLVQGSAATVFGIQNKFWAKSLWLGVDRPCL